MKLDAQASFRCRGVHVSRGVRQARFTQVDARFTQMDARFTRMETTLDRVASEVASLRSDVNFLRSDVGFIRQTQAALLEAVIRQNFSNIGIR